MKKLFKICTSRFAISIFVTIGFVIYFWVHTYKPFAVIPKIGQALPHNVSMADQEFKRRISEKYGDIKQSDILAKALREDGFRVNPSTRMAGFTKPGFFCSVTGFIHWEERDGVVTDLFAHYGITCV